LKSTWFTKRNKNTFILCDQFNQGTGGYSSFKVTAEFNIFENILHLEFNTSGTTYSAEVILVFYLIKAELLLHKNTDLAACERLTVYYCIYKDTNIKK